jgi:hypothetical protein
MSRPRAARTRPALILIAGGIVVGVAALAGLHAQALRASSAHEVARALERGLGLRARVARTRLELARLELALREDDLRQNALGREGWPFTSLRAADCRLSLQSAALAVELEHADVVIDANGETLRGRVRAPSGTLARAGVRHALARVSFAGALDPRRLSVERASLEAGAIRLNAREAVFDLPLGARGSAHVELDGELARAVELGQISGLPTVQGRVHAGGKVALNAGRLALDGTLRLERARIAGRELGERVELRLKAGEQGAQLSGALPEAADPTRTSFSAEPHFDAAGLRLASLRVVRGGSELRGRAHVDPTAAPVDVGLVERRRLSPS